LQSRVEKTCVNSGTGVSAVLTVLAFHERSSLLAFVKGVMMSLPRSRRAREGRAMPCVASLLLMTAVATGGCAKTTTGETAWVWPGSEPYNVAAAPAPRAPDIEDDGREAQLSPLRRAQPEPDDPNEPFSPNYGKQPLAQTVSRGGLATGPIPDDLPPAFRRRLADAVQD